jgi:hypothetical protein
MYDALKPILILAENLPPEELPDFLGSLEVVRVTAFARIAAPGTVQKDDRLIDVEELADRLHIHPDYIYRHQSKYKSFAHPQGSKLLWSSNGLDEYLATAHNRRALAIAAKSKGENEQ